MDSKGGFLCSFLVLSLLSLTLADDVNVTVKIEGKTTIGNTDDNFVCFTLDFWPPDKCNYGQCPWGKSGLFYLDLKNKILSNAIKAFNYLRIRIGGTLQDRVVYKVGNVSNCHPFNKTRSGVLGFSEGCLNMSRWDDLNQLFNETGAKITFGLNALRGKKRSHKDKYTWLGDWDPQNAIDLMKYSISKGYSIDSFELGNELCGKGIGARVGAIQYAKDVRTLNNALKQLYNDTDTRPRLIAPGGFYDEKWFEDFLKHTGQDVLGAVSHHLYVLGAGNDPNVLKNIKDPLFLTRANKIFHKVEAQINQTTPCSGAWISESGGAYNSGGKGVSNTFVDGFWFLDQLGISAANDYQVYCRQTFIGGNYAILDTESFVPNPDYYGALLWHRVMGNAVLRAALPANFNPHLRVYAHCAKTKPGISLLLINMDARKSFNVTLTNDQKLDTTGPDEAYFKGNRQREEYHLTPKDGHLQSRVVLLNGNLLTLTPSSDIPEMKPKLVDGSSPIVAAPHSFVYVTIKDFNVPACSQ